MLCTAREDVRLSSTGSFSLRDDSREKKIARRCQSYCVAEVNLRWARCAIRRRPIQHDMRDTATHCAALASALEGKRS